MRCDICHKIITKLSDHDPAFHVAKAYHTKTLDNRCISDKEQWPCKTIKSFK